jgi:hypothetical protein
MYSLDLQLLIHLVKTLVSVQNNYEFTKKHK